MPTSETLTAMIGAPHFRSFVEIQETNRQNSKAADEYMRTHYAAEWLSDDVAVNELVAVIEGLSLNTFVRVANSTSLMTTILHNETRGYYLIVAPLYDLQDLYDKALETVSQVTKH